MDNKNECHYNNATVRIHGNVNYDNLKKATTDFLTKAIYGKGKEKHERHFNR